MPVPNKQDLCGLPCPTRADLWIDRNYGRKSSLGYDRNARMAVHFAGDYIRPADAQVGELKFAHLFGTEQIAAIDNNGITQRQADPSVIQMLELIPLRQHQKSVGSVGRFVG